MKILLFELTWWSQCSLLYSTTENSLQWVHCHYDSDFHDAAEKLASNSIPQSFINVVFSRINWSWDSETSVGVQNFVSVVFLK